MTSRSDIPFDIDGRDPLDLEDQRVPPDTLIVEGRRVIFSWNDFKHRTLCRFRLCDITPAWEVLMKMQGKQTLLHKSLRTRLIELGWIAPCDQ